MKVVLDTNVLIAAFIARGACHELLEHCVLKHTVVASGFILSEFEEKLVSKFGFDLREAASAALLLRSRTLVFEPVAPPPRICRDRDDDNVLALASSFAVDCIVTGDRDLLDLRSHGEIPVLDPAGFWRFEARREG